MVHPRYTRAIKPKIKPINRMFKRISPCLMWLNSWATTPCNSSRGNRRMHPSVKPNTASSGRKPAAKALICISSSMTYTGGAGTPLAKAISSTTFSNRRSAGSRVLAGNSRPPSPSATTRPPPRSWSNLKPEASKTTAPTTPPTTKPSCTLPFKNSGTDKARMTRTTATANKATSQLVLRRASS